MTSAGRGLALFGGTPVLSKEAHRVWPVVEEEERRAVARVLDRGVLSGPFAPEAMAFQQEFAEWVGAKHALLTHSGTSALLVALASAGVRAGDEVIVPSYSFVATPLSVVQVGAIPVFADVDVETGCLDPAAAEAAVTDRTRAIMPVHMHGCAADLVALQGVARRHDLTLVEDAAQAHGAKVGDRYVGALGATGGFSLQSSKNLSAGEGGLFVTNDDGMAEEALSIANFGQDLSRAEAGHYDPSRPLDGTRSLDSRRLGSMYRGNEMMAAFGRAQLAKLRARTDRCQKNADRLAKALSKFPGVTAPVVPAGRTSVHHKFRVHVDPARAGVDATPRQLRDATIKALRAEGLEIVLWQSVPLSAQTIFQKHDPLAGFPQPRESARGGTDLSANYDPARYPRTAQLLEGSLVLFSQSCPLIAQDEAVVDKYAEAFARVWEHRRELVAAASPPKP